MEKAHHQHWMWMKRRELLKSHFPTCLNCSVNSSWEEKAFAEDASGHLGGCIWPPRSYSCSFCKREFRSAQALGGHMNVHRRDRAKLKESLSDVNCQPQSHSLSLDYDLELHHPNCYSSISLSSSRVSVLSTHNQENLSTQKQQKGCFCLTGSDSLAVKLFNISGSKPQVAKNLMKEDSHEDGFANTGHLFIGLNSVIGQNPPSGNSCSDEVTNCCKKPKTTDVSKLSLLMKPRSNDRFVLQSEVIGLNSSSLEDIDLELRLGEPPKVK